MSRVERLGIEAENFDSDQIAISVHIRDDGTVAGRLDGRRDVLARKQAPISNVRRVPFDLWRAA